MNATASTFVKHKLVHELLPGQRKNNPSQQLITEKSASIAIVYPAHCMLLMVYGDNFMCSHP